MEKNNSEILYSKKVEQRMREGFSDRLPLYLLGMGDEDPNIIDRLIEDRKAIYTKYNLPSDELLADNPNGFYSHLKGLVKKYKYNLEDKDFLERLGIPWTEGTNAIHAPFFKAIVAPIDPRTDYDFILNVKSLRHETTHMIQAMETPQMPDEIKEYEAYLVNTSEENLKNSPSSFFRSVSESVKYYYLQVKDGERPEWDNPFWVLKNIDGIEIEKPKFTPLRELDESILKWETGSYGFSQIKSLMIKMIGEKWEPYFNEILYYRFEFDRREIRSRYGLPIYRGASMERYVKDVMELADKEGISLNLHDRKPENVKEWEYLAKDLDEQFITEKQKSEGRDMGKPNFIVGYEAYVGAKLDLNYEGNMYPLSEIIWYADGKPPEDYS